MSTNGLVPFLFRITYSYNILKQLRQNTKTYHQKTIAKKNQNLLCNIYTSIALTPITCISSISIALHLPNMGQSTFQLKYIIINPTGWSQVFVTQFAKELQIRWLFLCTAATYLVFLSTCCNTPFFPLFLSDLQPLFLGQELKVTIYHQLFLSSPKIIVFQNYQAQVFHCHLHYPLASQC